MVSMKLEASFIMCQVKGTIVIVLEEAVKIYVWYWLFWQKITSLSLSLSLSFSSSLPPSLQDYWMLFVTRLFVGVGEASYATIAPTLIADLFPAEKRLRMLSIFYIAMPLGGSVRSCLPKNISKFDSLSLSLTHTHPFPPPGHWDTSLGRRYPL